MKSNVRVNFSRNGIKKRFPDLIPAFVYSEPFITKIVQAISRDYVDEADLSNRLLKLFQVPALCTIIAGISK